jgi:plasmid maintenance system antidote protein VapI
MPSETQEIFKKILTENHLTETAAAEVLGVTQQTVNAAKTGRRGLTLKRLREWAKKLGYEIVLTVKRM